MHYTNIRLEGKAIVPISASGLLRLFWMLATRAKGVILSIEYEKRSIKDVQVEEL